MIRDFVRLLKDALAGFGRHRAQWLAAAIAYFAIFAIAPLIIVVVEIAGLILGRHRALLDAIYGYLQQDAGPGAAGALRSIVEATFSQGHSGAVAQAIAWMLFALGAAGLFGSLHDALNAVWEVTPKKRGILQTIRDRALAFALVAAMALLLLVSVGISAGLTIAAAAARDAAPLLPMLLKSADFAASFAVLFGVFALLFRFLPECAIEWGEVWHGAAMTAALFVIGQSLLGWYLGRAGVASGFGAYGSLVIFLIWSNYSAQIVLFGAEFTRAFAHRPTAEYHADEKRQRGAGALATGP